jgi:hypothetical protein
MDLAQCPETTGRIPEDALMTSVIVLRDERAAGLVAPSTDGSAERTPPAAPLRAVLNVSRPLQSWRWTSALLVPFELLAVAWSVPLAILLVMMPVGLALAAVVWVGRQIFR